MPLFVYFTYLNAIIVYPFSIVFCMFWVWSQTTNAYLNSRYLFSSYVTFHVYIYIFLTLVYLNLSNSHSLWIHDTSLAWYSNEATKFVNSSCDLMIELSSFLETCGESPKGLWPTRNVTFHIEWPSDRRFSSWFNFTLDLL